tara:strand:- start:295007 stop:295825 length:819 start_codon:yes stop_codon:yes gene_type:complete
MFEQLVPACRDSLCGCDFVDVMQLVQNIMNFMIYLGTMVLVLILVYVGFLFITSQGNPGAIQKARSMAMSAVIGFVIILGGFLIVSTIMSTFADKNEYGDWDSFFGIEKQACEESLIFPQDPGTDNRLIGTDSITEEFAGYVAAFIATAQANGLSAIYEVSRASQRQALIDFGVPAENVLQVRRITSPHFSVYSSYGSGGTGSDECHDCVDLNDYGISTKDGDMATRVLAEALSRVDLDENVPNFRVTEAYPKTVSHAAACHNDGTCVDVNF